MLKLQWVQGTYTAHPVAEIANMFRTKAGASPGTLEQRLPTGHLKIVEADAVAKALILAELEEWRKDPTKSDLFTIDSDHWFHQDWDYEDHPIIDGDVNAHFYQKFLAEVWNMYELPNKHKDLLNVAPKTRDLIVARAVAILLRASTHQKITDQLDEIFARLNAALSNQQQISMGARITKTKTFDDKEEKNDGQGRTWAARSQEPDSGYGRGSGGQARNSSGRQGGNRPNLGGGGGSRGYRGSYRR